MPCGETKPWLGRDPCTGWTHGRLESLGTDGGPTPTPRPEGPGRSCRWGRLWFRCSPGAGSSVLRFHVSRRTGSGHAFDPVVPTVNDVRVPSHTMTVGSSRTVSTGCRTPGARRRSGFYGCRGSGEAVVTETGGRKFSEVPTRTVRRFQNRQSFKL